MNAPAPDKRPCHTSSNRPASLVVVHLLMGWVVAASVVVLTGCPTYEDTYSGTFREVVDVSNRNSDAVQVDLFRFGDNASAVVRLFKRDPITGDPFGEEQFCAWTSAETFEDAENAFRLYINKSSTQLPRSQLFGTVADDTELDITLVDERTGEPYDGIENLELERVSDEPDPDCQVIEDFAVSIDFPRDPSTGGTQTLPASSGHEISNPVFALSWVGVQPAQGRTVFAPVNRHAPAMRLDDGFGSNFDPSSHALRNDRTVLIAPPPDIVRMPSGTTTLALGHFVVVDDSEEDRPQEVPVDDWQFSWDTSSEKLVATTLQRATRAECDSGTNHWGRALLFVEDDLSDLAPEIQGEISGINQCTDAGTCDDHFFVVDVCADDTRVLGLTLNSARNSTTRTIPEVALFVTDEYLSATTIPLPRLNPY
jgi:hypothetical protein